MNWKLWLMSKIALIPTDSANRRQDKARDLPQEVGRHMIVKLGHDPDWVWGLKYVRETKDGSAEVFDIRIFNPQEAEQNHAMISDYASLNSYPDLILFTGWYDKKNNKVLIQEVKM